MFRAAPSWLGDETSFRIHLDLLVKFVFEKFVVAISFLSQVDWGIEAVLQAVVNAVVATPSGWNRLWVLAVFDVIIMFTVVVGVGDVGVQGVAVQQQRIFKRWSIEIPAGKPLA